MRSRVKADLNQAIKQHLFSPSNSKLVNLVSSRRRSVTLIVVAVLFMRVAAPSAFAATYYWDNNGATGGFGNAGDGSATWSSSGTTPTSGATAAWWNASNAGTGTYNSAVATTTSDTLTFGYNTTTTLGSGTITVSGTVSSGPMLINSGSGPVTFSGGTITFPAAATVTVKGSGSLITFNSPIAGAGTSFTTGNNGTATGKVNLGVANSYAGTTIINAGTLQLGTNNAIPNGSGKGNVQLLPSGGNTPPTLDLNTYSQTVNGLISASGVGFVDTKAGGTPTFTVGGGNADGNSFGGVIQNTAGTLSLTKIGTGTQTLTGNNTYNGNTIINAGNLTGDVTGSCSNSTVILNATNATLGVAVTTNTLSWDCAALTVSNAGTLQFNFGSITPSTNVGPLNITGLADFSTATPTVSVVVSSGLPAGTYPLMTWGSTAGLAPTNVTVSTMAFGATASLSVSNNTLNLVIVSTLTGGGAASVQVENYADGTGVIVPTTAILAGTVFTNYAIVRDASGNYLSNTPAVWQLNNITGSVVQGDLVAAPDGMSAVFTAHGNGSAQIVAQANATNLVSSGVINVTNSLYTYVRPYIWVRDTEKPGLLAKIATNSWATTQFNTLATRTASEMGTYSGNRYSFLRGLPISWTATPTFKTNAYSADTVETYYNTALDCAMMYYLTGKAIYAQCAADILYNSVQAYQNLAPNWSAANGGWLIPSDNLYEARQVASQLPLVYDFLYQYLQVNKVFDAGTSTMVSFNFTNAQTVFRTYYQLARDQGDHGDNWSSLEAPCMLNNLLALDSASERATDLQVYLVTGSSSQDSLDYDYNLDFINPGDIWHESFQYSTSVGTIRTYHMVLIERYGRPQPRSGQVQRPLPLPARDELPDLPGRPAASRTRRAAGQQAR